MQHREYLIPTDKDQHYVSAQFCDVDEVPGFRDHLTSFYQFNENQAVIELANGNFEIIEKTELDKRFKRTHRVGRKLLLESPEE